MTTRFVFATDVRIASSSNGRNVLGGHTFGLTREDFATVLTKAGFRPPAGMSVIAAWAQACKSGSPACQQGFNAMGAASLKTVTLDPSGKGNFAEMPPGIYYVFGSTRYGSGHLLWNLRIELRPSWQTLTLNERNAMPMD